MSPRTTKSKGAPKQAPIEDDLTRDHQSGDEHARLGFQYECACRCLWLLELRGTENKLLMGTGEDCELRTEDGITIYRQVKKKETGAWTLSDLSDFLVRAHDRFVKDETVRHEFYTNSSISKSLTKIEDGKKRLNAEHKGIQKLFPENREPFCSSVVLRDHHRQLNPNVTKYELFGEVRGSITDTYPKTHADDLADMHEIDGVVSRLFEAEFVLVTARSEVSWQQVEEIIGLDFLLREIAVRSRLGGTLVTWDQATGDPSKYLAREAGEALNGISSGKSIQRPEVEEKAYKLISRWGAFDHRSSSLLLIVGLHGSGKTWTLMRIGSGIASDPQYDFDVCVAAGPPPDDLTGLGGISSKPSVVLIDDFFSGWENLLIRPAFYLPEHVLFIGTASLDMDAAEIEALNRRVGQLQLLPLNPTLSQDEQEQLATIMRGLSAGQSEERRISETNIRHAAQILRGEHSIPHLDKLRQLLSDRGELWIDVSPVLFCTSIGLSIPQAFLVKYLGRAISDVLQGWMIRLEEPTGERIVFEDPSEANALIKEHFGSQENAWAFAPYDELLEKCEPESVEERIFARQLYSRLTRRNPELALSLAKIRKRKLSSLLRREPLWAIVFCWLPAFGRLDLEPELKEQFFKPVTAKLLSPPHTVVEFALWIEAYGSSEARKYLHTFIRSQSGWDVDLIVRFARMIRRLPRDEQKRVARDFCGILSDLPTFKFRECLKYPNAFGLLSALLEDHAGAFDRDRCSTEIGEFLAFEFKDMELVPANWMEPYIKLVDRTFQQLRSGLSIELTRALVNNSQLEDWSVKFRDCFEREQDRTITHLVEVETRIFEQAAQESEQDLDLRNIPGNILSVAVSWADVEEWEELSRQYLCAIERIATRKEVPLTRISPIVLPGFDSMKRWPYELRRRFLAASLTWVPGSNTIATEETTKFLIKFLHLCAKQDWLGETIRSLAKSCFLRFTESQAVSFSKELLQLLYDELNFSAGRPQAELSGMRDWVSRTGLAQTYLSHASTIDWSAEDKETIGHRLIELWGADENPSVLFGLAVCLARLNWNNESESVMNKVIERKPENSDAYAVLALLEGRRPDLDAAYKKLATTLRLLDQGKRGMHPWAAGWVHGELARLTRPPKRNLHLICEELMADRRLRPYEDLFRQPN